jgi:cellulose biosynthesis protein BcsQ
MPHALVIGIDRYSAQRIPTLKCAVNDAEEVSSRLESAGFDVVTLTNDGATRQDIYWELEIGINERVTDEDDPVLIYWAGHGMSDLRDDARKDQGWSTFLLPFDADVDRPMASAFAVQEVWALLDNLKTRRLLILLDTCFSGAFAGDSRGFVLGPARGETGSSDDFLQIEGHGRVVVSACGPNQVARENPKEGHGIFTRSLLAALERGTASGDRTAGVTQLMSVIREDVQRETRNAQTPSLHQSAEGADWKMPLPPPARYHPPMPSWAFVGTSGGVGKTTLAMMTAELLAESGNNVLYLDADIAQFGGTSEWCQRAHIDVGRVRTFADHVAVFSRARARVPARQLSDSLLDVTPEYLRRHGCGKILLLPATRASDKLFVFELVAEIKDRRSNAVCRQILDAAFDRGIRQGATCVVIDCGAQFDPLAVNSITAADHPFVVAAARGGAKDQRETILSNCTQTVEDFDRLRMETVVNRVPSMDALTQSWGSPGHGRPGMSYHWLPFDRKLFQDWEEGRPNFELGYDDLSQTWHEILVASDRNSCEGLHRDLLPTEWDRFAKWALWLFQNPDWAGTLRDTLGRRLRRLYPLVVLFLGLLGAGGAGVFQSEDSILPYGLSIAFLVTSLLGLPVSALAVRGVRRRRKVLDEVIKHSLSMAELKKWFNIPSSEGPWWKLWESSRRAAIEWLHGRVTSARAAESPASAPIVVSA